MDPQPQQPRRPLDLSELSVPNLDCFSVDPNDYDAIAAVFFSLAHYAAWTGEAMRARAENNVPWALKLEKVREQEYLKLPPEIRW